MTPFRPYASRALIFAVAASVLTVLFTDVLALLLAHEAIGFLPKYFALSFGTVHSPSYLGLFAGFFFEWAVIGLFGAFGVWLLARRRSEQSAT